jgi:putative Mg2+ transporter-C (MgtC) family protein
MLHWSEIVIRLVTATMIGAAIGLNREFHHKQSGLKTLGLVGLGAALAVLTVAEIGPDPNAYARVIQGLVVGVGFIGAGVIVHEQSTKRVRGLTTAASVWVTACLGAACGAGAWVSVATASIAAGALLIIGRRLEKQLRRAIGDHRGQPEDDGTPHPAAAPTAPDLTGHPPPLT